MFPIIYKMTQQGVASRIMILCQNLDYDIRDDFILNYLKKEFGIKAEYSYNIDKSALRCFLSRLLLSARRIQPKIGVWLFKRLHRLLYDQKWADNLLANVNASTLILDFQSELKYSTKNIIKAAKMRMAPVIFITHGVTMRISGLKQVTNMPSVDYKIFPNRLKVDFFKDKNDSNQNIKILGSPRYCDEWEKIYNKLLENIFPCHGLSSENDKLNVLFFERPMINLNKGHSLEKEVEKLDFVNTVFKERLEKKNPFYMVKGSNYPSARLIQWADVVVMSISSIALEVLWQNRPLLFLKYLAPNDACVFEDYKACWVMKSETDLIDALRMVHKNPGYRPYKDEDVSKLFKEVVYAGDPSLDVLNNYSDFILGVSQKGQPNGGEII
ncbi:MAG: hypothetical protein JRC68_05255 [Deltaproteobacteria bacterium]|nr:hypothetical protein [Deltaproteobacteria bacterium]